MKRWLFAAAFSVTYVVAWGCGDNAPPVRRPQKPTCESVCRHLAILRCPAAASASAGMGCQTFCIPKWDLACIERAETCHEANACVRDDAQEVTPGHRRDT